MLLLGGMLVVLGCSALVVGKRGRGPFPLFALTGCLALPFWIWVSFARLAIECSPAPLACCRPRH